MSLQRTTSGAGAAATTSGISATSRVFDNCNLLAAGPDAVATTTVLANLLAELGRTPGVTTRRLDVTDANAISATQSTALATPQAPKPAVAKDKALADVLIARRKVADGERHVHSGETMNNRLPLGKGFG